jgi:acyl dehydratase
MTMEMQVGQSATYRRTFTQDEFNRFAALSGDDNPIHVDAQFSARTHFGRTVAHGMLLYTALCGALAQFCPGAVQLEQELMFPAPTYVGEEVTIVLRVLETRPGFATVSTAMQGPDGSSRLQGQTAVRLAGAQP